MNPLLQLAIQATPTIIAAIKDLFHKQNPNEPQITDEEAIAALKQAFDSSLAKDDDWLATHPEDK